MSHMEKEIVGHKIDIIRNNIRKVFSPIFNDAEIPEVLFNPANRQIREVRIREYIASIDDDVAESSLRTLFTNLTEVPIRQKIIHYLALFCEDGLEADFLEVDKTRIFGSEVETIGLEKEFFRNSSRKGFRGSGGGPLY